MVFPLGHHSLETHRSIKGTRYLFLVFGVLQLWKLMHVHTTFTVLVALCSLSFLYFSLSWKVPLVRFGIFSIVSVPEMTRYITEDCSWACLDGLCGEPWWLSSQLTFLPPALEHWPWFPSAWSPCCGEHRPMRLWRSIPWPTWTTRLCCKLMTVWCQPWKVSTGELGSPWAFPLELPVLCH